MALFGPRLDRPSAIGDEGRPRATSLTIVSLLVFVLLLVSLTCPWRWGVSVDGWMPVLDVPACARLGSLALGLATATGLTTAGLALLNRERLASLFIGQVIFLPAGTALVGGVGVLVYASPPYGLLLSGFAVAMVALGSTWADSATADAVRPALFQEGVAYLSMFLWAIFGAVLALAVIVVRGITGANEPTLSLLAFLAFLFLGSLLFRLGLRWLPVRQSVPRARRERVEGLLGKLRLVNTVVVLGSLVGGVVGVVLALLGLLSALYTLVPPVAVLFRLLVTAPVLVAVLGSGLFTLVAGLLALALRRLTKPVDTTANRLIAPLLAGLFLTIGLIPFAFSLLPVPLPPVVAIVIIVVGPIALYLLGGVFVIAELVGILPSRAGGPALAAGGMVLATVGAALAGLPGPVVLVTAAVAMIVWDVSSFGLGVTAELGHLPETRRLELFHALVAFGVGVVAVAALSLLELLRTTVAGSTPALVAGAFAVFGVLVLLLPLRGYVRGEAVD